MHYNTILTLQWSIYPNSLTFNLLRHTNSQMHMTCMIASTVKVINQHNDFGVYHYKSAMLVSYILGLFVDTAAIKTVNKQVGWDRVFSPCTD